MALPMPLRTSITPAELELVAMEHLVDIIPLFRSERIRLISGTYGPFRPPTKTKVPLWLATNLKLKKKCRLVAPTWLSVEFLQDRLTQETSAEGFSSLPFRFSEICKVILDVASDDLQNPDKIRTLLKDLREARQAKSRDGLKKLDHLTLGLPHLCSMEINEIRPFFVRAMDVMGKIKSETIPEHLSRQELQQQNDDY